MTSLLCYSTTEHCISYEEWKPEVCPSSQHQVNNVYIKDLDDNIDNACLHVVSKVQRWQQKKGIIASFLFSMICIHFPLIFFSWELKSYTVLIFSLMFLPPAGGDREQPLQRIHICVLCIFSGLLKCQEWDERQDVGQKVGLPRLFCSSEHSDVEPAL